MMQYKHFKKEGNLYILKHDKKLAQFLVVFVLALAALLFYLKIEFFGWMFIMLAGIFLMSSKKTPLIIDLNKKEIQTKRGLLGKKISVPISQIVDFQFFVMTQMYIPISTALNMYYLEGDKEKTLGLASAFTKKPIQEIMNEVQEIIEHAND